MIGGLETTKTAAISDRQSSVTFVLLKMRQTPSRDVQYTGERTSAQPNTTQHTMLYYK